MGISKPSGKQVLGLLVAITRTESYETLDNIVSFPCGILVQEVQSFFIRGNTGFNNSFEGSHEYRVVQIVATKGWRFLDWKGTNPLLLGN